MRIECGARQLARQRQLRGLELRARACGTCKIAGLVARAPLVGAHPSQRPCHGGCRRPRRGRRAVASSKTNMGRVTDGMGVSHMMWDAPAAARLCMLCWHGPCRLTQTCKLANLLPMAIGGRGPPPRSTQAPHFSLGYGKGIVGGKLWSGGLSVQASHDGNKWVSALQTRVITRVITRVSSLSIEFGARASDTPGAVPLRPLINGRGGRAVPTSPHEHPHVLGM